MGIIKSKKSIVLVFFISAIVIIVGFALGGFMPFGDKDILSASGNEKLIAFYYELWDSFHEGNLFFFSTRVGGGYDFSTVITYYLSDPLNLFILLLPKTAMLGVLNILYIIKMSFSGVFFYLFLSRYSQKKDEKCMLKMALSVAYALSGYSCTYGMDTSVSSIVILFPLVIIGIERLYNEHKPFLYVCFMSLCCLINFRLSITLFIFSLLYIIAFHFTNIKDFASSFLIKLYSDIFAVGIASVVVVNNLTSSYFDKEYSACFPELNLLKDKTEIVKALFSDQYVGVIVLLSIFIFFLISNISFWKKLRVSLLSLFLFSSCIISTPNFLMNGFSKTMSGRCSICFSFSVLLMCYDTLSNLKIDEHSFGAYETMKSFTKRIVKVLPIMILVEMICVGAVRIAITGKNAIAYQKTDACKIEKCIDYVHENYADAKVLLYDSSDAKSTPVSNLLLGYNYIIQVDGRDEMDACLVKVAECEGYNIFYNPDTKPDNRVVNYAFKDWKSDSQFVFASCNELTNSLHLGDVFDIVDDNIQVSPDLTDKSYKTTNLFYSFDKPGEYYVNYHGISYLGCLESGEEAVKTYHMSPEEMKEDILTRETVSFNKEVYDKLKETVVDNAVTKNSETMDSHAITLIPYDVSSCFDVSSASGNADLKYYEVFSDRVAILADEQEDSLITYRPRYLIKGAIISAVSLIIIIFFYVLSGFAIKNTKNKLEKLHSIIEDNRVSLYVFLLSTLVWVMILMINSCVPFGSNSAVVSDGFIEDYPTTMSLIHNLKHGVFSAVDYSIGIQRGGISLASFQYFMNPLRLIMLLFPDSKSLLAFNVFYGCLFVLSGQSMLFYLIHKPYGNRMDKRELKLIPIAMCYNLSSFLLCYYSYGGFLEFALIIPLIMLAMDRLIYEKKYMFYTIVLAYYMVLSTYFAFLLCIFLVIYFFALDHHGLKNMVKNGVRFACFSMISAGIASFSLLSFYGSVTNSGYIEQDTTDNSSINWMTQNLLGNITDFEVIHRINQATTSTNVANTYAGLLLLLIIPVFLLLKKYGLSYRIRRVFLLALLYFAYGNDLLNYVFHGFHFQSMVPNRFSLFFIFMLVVTFYEVVCDYKCIFERESVIAFVLFSAAVLLTMYYKSVSSFGGKLVSIIFIIIYCAVVLLGYKTRRQYKYSRILLLVLALELMVSSINSARGAFNGFPYLQKSSEVSSELAKEYNMKQGGVVRASLINETLSNLACVSEYNSVDVFTSTLQAEQINTANNWGTEQGVNYLMYGFGNPMSDIMLNNRYFFVNSNYLNSSIPSYLRKIDSKSFISLYENPFVSGVGVYVPESVMGIDYKDFKNSIEYQNALSEELMGRKLYEIVKSDEYETSYLEDEGRVLFDINGVKTSGDYFASYCNRIAYIGNVSEGEEIEDASFRVTSDEKRTIKKSDVISDAEVARLDMDSLEVLSDYVKKNTMTDVMADKDGISGNVNCIGEGYVYIPVLPDNGWIISVDGKEVTSEIIMSGIGIKVSSGSHSIKMTRNRTSSVRPYILSIVSMIVLLGFFVLDNKRKRLNYKFNDTESNK